MKKIAVFLLCLCLLGPLLPARAAEEPPAWAAEAYTTLQDRKVSTPLYPSGPINRGEFTELLVALLDSSVPQGELEPYPMAAEDYFSDLSYFSYRRAAGYGILEGTVGEDGLRRADPTGLLTREQAAKMVCSLLDFFSQELSHSIPLSESPAVYTDAASISSWALPYTQQIASYGLMKGDDNGNFDPLGKLDWPSSVVLARRTLDLLDAAMAGISSGQPLSSAADWSGASRFGANDYSVSKPKTGWAQGYYTISNGDGTVSGLVVGVEAITVERFDADGSLVSSKTVERELPIFGAFLDSGDHFYLAFGQDNPTLDNSREVFRVVQYDREWNRLGAVSVNGKDSYTNEPFRSSVARMAVSADGETIALYAARKRYDGHQSNITLLMNASPFAIQEVMGEEFPSNHVSHSFGQFIQFDGERMVTVDHGDAYPRSFVLQDGSREIDLLKIAGDVGDNVTHAIGSGFAVSEDGYLFLGCSDPQQGNEGDPWNLFLAYVGKRGNKAELRWLTDRETTIDRARLVKLEEDRFLAMWQEGADIHYQTLDGKGELMGEEQVLSDALMPPTDPVVIEGKVCWIQLSPLPQHSGKAVLYRLDTE